MAALKGGARRPGGGGGQSCRVSCDRNSHNCRMQLDGVGFCAGARRAPWRSTSSPPPPKWPRGANHAGGISPNSIHSFTSFALPDALTSPCTPLCAPLLQPPTAAGRSPAGVLGQTKGAARGTAQTHFHHTRPHCHLIAPAYNFSSSRSSAHLSISILRELVAAGWRRQAAGGSSPACASAQHAAAAASSRDAGDAG